MLARSELPEEVGEDLETRRPVEVLEGKDAVIQADPDQLEQALINLVRNAVDATLETDGAGVTLRWISQEEGGHLLIEDEGPGLSDTGNLFVPFYTTKQGGSGIGFVLSHQIAEGHGGTLELENRQEYRCAGEHGSPHGSAEVSRQAFLPPFRSSECAQVRLFPR